MSTWAVGQVRVPPSGIMPVDDQKERGLRFFGDVIDSKKRVCERQFGVHEAALLIQSYVDPLRAVTEIASSMRPPRVLMRPSPDWRRRTYSGDGEHGRKVLPYAGPLTAYVIGLQGNA